MKNPNIKTKVVHSLSKSSWNVIGETLGSKYKIVRAPYFTSDNKELTAKERKEAFNHAEYISWCFNNSTLILKTFSKIEDNDKLGTFVFMGEEYDLDS